MSGRGQSWPIGPSIDRLAEFLDRVVNDTVVVQIPVARFIKFRFAECALYCWRLLKQITSSLL